MEHYFPYTMQVTNTICPMSDKETYRHKDSQSRFMIPDGVAETKTQSYK